MTNENPLSGPSDDEKLMAALAYLGMLLLLIPTVIVMITKQESSPWVKKHCLQAIVTFVALLILSVVIFVVTSVIGFIPVIGWIFSILVGIASMLLVPVEIILTIYLAYKAYQGDAVRIPFVTDFVETKL